MDRKQILVVANRTVESEELLRALIARARGEQVSFTLLVPATPSGIAWAADMDSGGPAAERRLARGRARLEAAGLSIVAARLGHPDPLAAVADAVNFETYDEIVVSTLPRSLSQWLGLSLPFRVERMTGLPVLHVTSRRRLAPGAFNGSHAGRRRPAPLIVR